MCKFIAMWWFNQKNKKNNGFWRKKNVKFIVAIVLARRRVLHCR